MKKTISILAASALALTLVACGGGSDTNADETTTVETTVEETTVTHSGPTQDELDAWAKNVVGLSADQEFIEAATDEIAPSWAATINSVRLDGSNLYINSQINRQTETDTAETIERMYHNALTLTPPEWADRVDWVIVEDGTGVVITQKMI